MSSGKSDGKDSESSQEPSNPAYFLDIAQVQLNYNVVDRAEASVRRATALAASGADAQLKLRSHELLAQILDRKNDLPGAGEQYAAVLELAQDPVQRIQTTLALASVKTKAKDFEGAAKLLAAASEAVKTAANGVNLNFLAQDIRAREMDLARQDPQRADPMIKEAEAALEKNPKDIAALERLSEVYSTLRPDAAKAIAIQEKLAEAKPDSVVVLSRLSSLYQQNKQPEKALETTRRLMKAAPKEQQTFYAYQAAMQMAHAGKAEDGLKLLEETAGSEPKARDLSLLASAYEQTNNLEKAEKSLRRAVDLKEQQPSEKATTLIRIADLSRRRKDYAGAETLLRGVMKDYADQPNIQNYAKSSLTQMYREQGKELKE